MRRLLLVSVSLLWCVGCATATPPVAPVVVEAPPPVEVPAPVLVDQRTTLPPEEFMTLVASEPDWRPEPPVKTIQQASRRATIGPRLAAFDGAVLVYPYRPGVIYRVDVALTGTVHLELQEDEEVYAYSGLRAIDWIIQWEREPPEAARHFLITPKEAGVIGRFTLVTNYGRYYLDLHAHEQTTIRGVRWHHPPAGRTHGRP